MSGKDQQPKGEGEFAQGFSINRQREDFQAGGESAFSSDEIGMRSGSLFGGEGSGIDPTAYTIVGGHVLPRDTLLSLGQGLPESLFGSISDWNYWRGHVSRDPLHLDQRAPLANESSREDALAWWVSQGATPEDLHLMGLGSGQPGGQIESTEDDPSQEPVSGQDSLDALIRRLGIRRDDDMGSMSINKETKLNKHESSINTKLNFNKYRDW